MDRQAQRTSIEVPDALSVKYAKVGPAWGWGWLSSSPALAQDHELAMPLA